MPSPLTPAVTYAAKVWVAGLAAAFLVPLALVTALMDTLLRTAPDNQLSPRVLAWSAEIEVALDAHGDLTDLRMTPAGRRARS